MKVLSIVRIPKRLETLIDEGVITDVVRPLMSGKEAQVYMVRSGDDLGVAKVYKEAQHRSFKHRSQYTEGRGVRSSRDSRAMQKGSRYGRQKTEDAWKNAEVDVIYRLTDAGVRVPSPYYFHEGVLVMELITDAEGEPAHRLGDVELDREMAQLFFDILLREVVRMTVAGVVHGDLSEFNILVGADGPVIIDFPQAIDPASNPNARGLLIRDVNNLVRFISRYDPRYRGRRYGQEIWAAYERAELTPDTELTGHWKPAHGPNVDTAAVVKEIREANAASRSTPGRRVYEPPRPPKANPKNGRPHGHGGETRARPAADPASRQNGRPHGHGGETRARPAADPASRQNGRPHGHGGETRARPAADPASRRTNPASSPPERPVSAQARGANGTPPKRPAGGRKRSAGGAHPRRRC